MANVDPSNKEKGNFKDKFRDVKYRAKMELVFYGVFILALVCLANVNGRFSTGDTDLDENSGEISGEIDSEDDEQELEIASLYERLRDSSYAYEIRIVGKTEEESFEYLYTGKVTESGNSITYLDQVYNVVEGKFYVADSSEEVREEVLFPVVSYNYLDFSKIDKIISEGEVEYKTNYSNGNKAISYVINLNDLFFDDNSGNSISILVLETSDEVSLEMDYRYLVNVLECQVSVRYLEIGV